MSNEPADTSSNQSTSLLVMRIIVGAMMLGVIVFFAVAVGIRANATQPPPALPIVGLLGLGFAPVALVLAVVVPFLMALSWQRQIAGGTWPAHQVRGGPLLPPTPAGALEPEEEVVRWWAMYQTQLIIRCALIEGAIFFQLTAYIAEGSAFSLWVAAVLLAALVAQWPTRERIDRWAAARQEAVDAMQKGEIP